MAFPRSTGILLHPTSLPSLGGIGDFGPAAYEFVDFLAAARQSLWQILPLAPAGYGNSPYSSLSAFAGDRKSTRLNSSHMSISYAVFCLKKKKKKNRKIIRKNKKKKKNKITKKININVNRK